MFYFICIQHVFQKVTKKHDLSISNESLDAIILTGFNSLSRNHHLARIFCTTEHWELCTKSGGDTNNRNVSTLSWRVRRYHQVMTWSLLSTWQNIQLLYLRITNFTSEKKRKNFKCQNFKIYWYRVLCINLINV